MSIQQEFDFTKADFERVRRIVYDHAGIALADSKQNLIYNRLSRRLRSLNFHDFNHYLTYVEGEGREEEFTHLINAVTTNLTFFFREVHHFEYLSQVLFPSLLKSNAHSKKVRIWSAGCSTGEEPYSLAIVVKESFPSDWDVQVHASDLDTNVINTAKAGVYQVESLKGVSPERVKRWFLKGSGANDGLVRIKPELQSLIQFQQVNLMRDWPWKERFDIIFCRNVVIYFDKPTQQKLFMRYHELLSDQGHLFIGHSESLYKVSEQFKLLGKTIYQKI
ncbi:MAG: protein-glutamate O-methyltransferase [Gammaproteobacteria bacterium]|nr:protein-glutamate O-methyltransferase [Gammaproteobacteria bacterium]